MENGDHVGTLYRPTPERYQEADLGEPRFAGLRTYDRSHGEDRSAGSDDLLYYVVADNPPADIINYPDSNKWVVKPHRKGFIMQETDYYAGEE